MPLPALLPCSKASDFGNQFAHQDLHICNECEAQRYGEQMCVHLGVRRNRRQQVQPTQKQIRGKWLSNPAQGERTERYTQLNGGKKIIQFLLELQHSRVHRAPPQRPGYFARYVSSHADQRKFGSHKECIHQNQAGLRRQIEAAADRASRL